MRKFLNTRLATAMAGSLLLMTGAHAQTATPASEPGVEIYLPTAFAEFLPQNANDLVRRLPGFQVDEGDDVRGLSGAQGNVLINGRRPPTRSGSIGTRLSTLRVEDVERLELIEAGARDIDMQGYPLLLNIVLRDQTDRRINGRMEIEPREDGGDEVQLAFGGSMTGGGIDLEGNFELYDEALIAYEDVRSSTADAPTARLSTDRNTTMSRRDAQGSATLPLSGGRSLVLSGAYDSYANSQRPTAEEVASGAALQETNEFENADTSFGLEYTAPFRGNMDLHAMLTRTDGEQESSASLTEMGTVNRSTSGEETSETATRATLRWRMGETWAIEAGGTWAHNTLDGSSAASIDGVVQDIDGSTASVEETRAAALAVASWTPRADLTANFGGRVEQFSLNSSNSPGELTLTDVIPRADMTWTLDNGWVLRVSGEREVGQLDLDLFLAETNLDNALNTAGAATLEPERAWVYRVELERRFGERNLLRVLGERREVDNPISRVLTLDGDVTPANIGPETIDTLEGVFEMDFGQFGIPGLFVDGIAVLRDSERIDPLQGFVRQTSGLAEYTVEIGVRQEFAGGKFILGMELEQDAPSTHYWLTQIRHEDRGLEARINGEWRHSDTWRTGFWTRLPESIREERQIFDGVRTPGDDPVLENIIERENGAFVSLWTEFEMREEVFLRLNVRTGRDREATTLVNAIDGSPLDSASVDVDNVPSFNLRLRWNR
ncbi:MAG: TonB-dependent receptor [Maricaulis sp.]|uniref:TonB-dependent receptor plug domain-containing protein n=1 Tax=Maricaulis sp. TaxID=1486257 RepID=UPI001B039784|nr:TonB-dependent receptor [Maricaulis sp.]MBO6846926.1 TonB-dependent receptor [Maricaulis sp.]MBO6876285.1 TonB-dependent receptor [Maricaulis sp.]